MELKAEPGCCQEASPASHSFYIPCNQPAVKVVKTRDPEPYRMCLMCATHNQKNRGAVIWGDYNGVDPMSSADLIVWSAVFARTNMGQSMPSANDIRRYRTAAAHRTSLPAMVNMVCADYIETDEHYEMFLDEAKSWMDELRLKNVDYILQTWSDKQVPWREAIK